MPAEHLGKAHGSQDSATLVFTKILADIKKIPPSDVDVGSEFWNTLESAPWPRLLSVREKRQQDGNVPISRKDSRTATIAFLLGLWSPSSSSERKARSLGFKGLLPSLLKGLPGDSDHVVAAVLQQFWTGLLQDASIDSRIRANLAEKAVEAVVKIADIQPHDDTVTSRSQNPQRFLLVLAHNIRNLGFPWDLQRKVAATFFTEIKIVDHADYASAAVHLCQRFPEITGLLWNKLSSSLEPRLSTKWILAAAKAVDILTLPISPENHNMILDLHRPGQKLSSEFALFDLCFPSSSSKSVLSKGLQHDNDLVVYLSSNLLFASLQRSSGVISFLEEMSLKMGETKDGLWKGKISNLREEARNRLPDPQILIGLLQRRMKAYQSSDDDRSTGDITVCSALRILHQYLCVTPEQIDTMRFDFVKLLESTSTSNSPIDALSHLYLLKLVSSLPPSLSVQWSSISHLIRLYLNAKNASLRSEALSAICIKTKYVLLFDTGSAGNENFSDWLIAFPRNMITSESEFLMSFLISTCLQISKPNLDIVDTHLTSGTVLSPFAVDIIQRLSRILEERSSENLVIILKYLRAVSISFLGLPNGLAKARELLSSVLTLGNSENENLEEWERMKGVMNYLDGGNELQSEHAFEFGENAFSRTPLEPILACVRAASLGKLPENHRHQLITMLKEHSSQRTLTCFSRIVSRSMVGWTGDSEFPQRRSADEITGLDHFLFNLLMEIPPSQRIFCLSKVIDELLPYKEIVYSPEFSRLYGVCFDPSIRSEYQEWLKHHFEITEYNWTPIIQQTVLENAFTDDLKKILRKMLLDADLKLWNCYEGNISTEPYKIELLRELINRQEDISELIQEHFDALTSSLRDDPILGTYLAQSIGKIARSEKMHGLDMKTRLLKKQLMVRIEKILQGEDSGFVSGQVLSQLILYYPDAYSKVNKIPKDKLEPLLRQSNLSALQSYISVFAAKGEGHTVIRGWLQDKVPSLLISQLIHPDKLKLSSVPLCHTLVEATKIDNAFPSAFSRELQASLQEEATLVSEGRFHAKALESLKWLASHSSDAVNMLNAYLNASLLWIVRRFSEDETNSDAVIDYIRQLVIATNELGSKAELKWFRVEPVIESAIRNRLSDYDSMNLVQSIVPAQHCSEHTAVQYLGMVTEHKKFRAATETTSKSRIPVVKLIYTMAFTSSAVLQRSGSVPALANIYGGTFSESDKLLLRILRFAESSNALSFREIPLQWAGRKKGGENVSVRTSVEEFSLDPKQVHRTSVFCFKQERTSETALGEVYDPMMLLSMLAIKLDNPYLKPHHIMATIRIGLLGFAICAMASEDKSFRLIADRLLSKARNIIQDKTFTEKDEILFVLQHAQNVQPSSIRRSIPPTIALFLSHCTKSLSTPEDYKYPIFMKFLLQRPLVDLTDLPLFYTLLYSSGATSSKDRTWLVNFMAEAMQTEKDWLIMKRRQGWGLLSNLWETRSLGPGLRTAILNFLLQASRCHRAVVDLIAQLGILPWISRAASVHPEYAVAYQKILFQLIHTWDEKINSHYPTALNLFDFLTTFSVVTHDSQVSFETLKLRSSTLRKISILCCSGLTHFTKISTHGSSQEEVLNHLRNALLALVRVVKERSSVLTGDEAIDVCKDVHDATVRCLGVKAEFRGDEPPEVCHDVDVQLFKEVMMLRFEFSGDQTIRSLLLNAWHA